MTRVWGSEDLNDSREYYDPDPRRHDAVGWDQNIGPENGILGADICPPARNSGAKSGHFGPTISAGTQNSDAQNAVSGPTISDEGWSRTLAALDGDAGDSIYARMELEDAAWWDDWESDE